MVSVTHATVAAGTDAGNGEIAKAQWNEAHTLSQATATILGRVTAGTGTTEELTASQVRTLINVEDGADVTDATNVDAAGAVMNADTSTAGMSFVDGGSVATNSATKVPTQAAVKTYVDSSDAAYYSAATSRANHYGTQLASTISDFSTAADLRISAAILDEDDMASNSATKVPTQQSVKAYVDAATSGGGNPANVGYAAKTDTFATTSTTWTDLTGVSVSITPSSTSSRILILVQLTIGTSAASTYARAKILRGSTDVLLGAAEGSRTQAHAWLTSDAQPASMFLMAVDSPATTSATTYKIQLQTNSGTIYVNRSESDTDNAVSTRGASTITVMEIV